MLFSGFSGGELWNLIVAARTDEAEKSDLCNTKKRTPRTYMPPPSRAAFAHLVENETYAALHASLHQCHSVKMNIFSIVMNVAIVLLVVGGFGYFLYSRYTERPTEFQRRQKLMRDQQYVIHKIRTYQDYERQKQKLFAAKDVKFVESQEAIRDMMLGMEQHPGHVTSSGIHSLSGSAGGATYSAQDRDWSDIDSLPALRR